MFERTVRRALSGLMLMAFAQFSLAGELGGLVTDASGKLLHPAMVSAKHSDGKVYSSVTSADGRWLIESLPNGTYRITALAAGHRTTEQVIEVSGSAKIKVQLVPL